jgi:hypothetical protein
MEINKSHLNVIINVDRKMMPNEYFNFLMEEISSHVTKLKKLREKEDKPGHFKEEVCDMYILARLLFEFEKINKTELDSASKHFADKVTEIYKK